MESQAISREHIIYGVQLWTLNCLYWDGRNYRYSRAHAAVDPALRGHIAVPVNRALKHQFANPGELHAYAKGTITTMPTPGTDLGRLLPRGCVVSTLTTRESRTGRTYLVVLTVVHGEIVAITAAVAGLLSLPIEHGQLHLDAPRARAGQTIVSNLAAALHGDPHALDHQSLG
jgi:hypothetical protein